MKFALLTVSYSGMFYAGPALSIEEQIRKARELGFDGLAIESKRPIASPLDLAKKDRERIRKVAADEGITLCCLESMSNFAGRYMEDRENNLAMMRLTIDMAADLGIPSVKIFAAWPGIINDEEPIAMYAAYEKGKYYKRLNAIELRIWNRAVEGIREAADYAARAGITLALQNHAPVLAPGYEDALAMTEEVNRENVKLCLDVPLFGERQQDDYVSEAVRRCGKYNIHTHYGAWNFRQTKDGRVLQEPSPSFGEIINYKTFFAEMEQIGFEGYATSEYCLPCIKNHKIAGIEEIDKANRISLQYMKELVRQNIAHIA